MASTLTQRLYNLNTKDPSAKKVPVKVWEALVDVISAFEDLDMVLHEDNRMYRISGDVGSAFITSIAVLDEAIWDNEND